jgi:hypothetical protein
MREQMLPTLQGENWTCGSLVDVDGFMMYRCPASHELDVKGQHEPESEHALVQSCMAPKL